MYSVQLTTTVLQNAPSLVRVLGSIRETLQRGPFLSLLMARLKGTLLRGSVSSRVPLIQTPRQYSAACDVLKSCLARDGLSELAAAKSCPRI